MHNELNAAIARWMGEPRPTEENFRDGQWVCLCPMPDYLHDPAAALRVLARMNKVCRHYELDNDSEGNWQVWLWDGGVHHIKVKAPTPAAAICAAWLVEFGGEHGND